MSAHRQLAEWAHARDCSPRRYWRRRRGVRHELEHQAQAEQLDLLTLNPAVKGPGVVGKSPSAPGHRPTPFD